MKTSAHHAIAIATLLILPACSGDTSGKTPAQEHVDHTATAQASGADGAPSVGAASASTDLAQAPAAQAEPPPAFMQCRSCHSIEPGKNGIGPSLAGIIGKPAASVAGFNYSSALQGAGITWTRDKLDEWLAGPTQMVPGTRMVTTVRNEEQRKAILDYLETLK